jgi:hypothetical protein
MAALIEELTQPQRDRLAFIELRMRFLGEVRRQDLIARFGIQAAAASRDLASYKDLVPGNIDYDGKNKVYVRAAWFRPLFDFSPARVLTWLTQGYGDNEPVRHRPLIATEAATEISNPNLETLSVVTRAIFRKTAVQITYRALTSGLTTREIAPSRRATSPKTKEPDSCSSLKPSKRTLQLAASSPAMSFVKSCRPRCGHGLLQDIADAFKSGCSSGPIQADGRGRPPVGFRPEDFDPMMARDGTRPTWSRCRTRSRPSTSPCCRASRCATCWLTTPAPARPSWPASTDPRVADARRRQTRVIVAPGSLVEQWQDEMFEKFGLTFTLFSREQVEQSRRAATHSTTST